MGTAVKLVGLTSVSGDTLSGGTFAYTDKNVGSANKTVTTTGVTVNDGNGGANYNVTYADNTTSTITAKNVTISGLSASNKDYSGNASAVLGGAAALTDGAISSADGKFYTGDALTVGGTAAGSFADANAGTGKSVTVTGNTLAGSAASNYVLVQQTGLTADINKAHLTVTADNQSRLYGAANPGLTQTISGFVNSEVLATSGVSGTATGSTTASGTTAVGSATITAAAGTLAASNYDFTNLVDGTLTISPAAAPSPAPAVAATTTIALPRISPEAERDLQAVQGGWPDMNVRVVGAGVNLPPDMLEPTQ